MINFKIKIEKEEKKIDIEFRTIKFNRKKLKRNKTLYI